MNWEAASSGGPVSLNICGARAPGHVGLVPPGHVGLVPPGLVGLVPLGVWGSCPGGVEALYIFSPQ